MQKWLISSDTEKWDNTEYLAENGFIYWKKRYNYERGDIVYIYSKKPIAKVLFKTCVEDISSNKNSEDDWVKFHLIDYIDTDELSLDNLREHDLINPPQGAKRIDGELGRYIDKFFDKDSSIEKENSRMWLVKAGENSVKIDTFKKNNFVAIGWEFGDLKGKSREDIKLLCKQSDYTYNDCLYAVNAFVNEIKFGDYILTYNTSKKEFYIGKCTSDYYFSEKMDTPGVENQYKNCRDVVWSNVVLKNDELPQDIFNHLNLPGTLFEIQDNDIKEKIFNFYNLNSFASEKRRNLIFFGAPGTGKSYNLNKHKDEFLKKYVNNVENNYERVTFHPDYTYSNFVGTYKPVIDNRKITFKPVIEEDNTISYKRVIEDNEITYKYVPGPFMRTLVKAINNPYEPFILIIEEINRANVASVFGDVFQLLDRDNVLGNSEYPVNTSEDMKKYIANELKIDKVHDYREFTIEKYLTSLLGENFDKIKIPSNMFIWATMNSADQGVFPMDTAFKRRWDFEYLDINNNAYEIKNIVINDVPEEWNVVNNKISWNDLRIEINNELLRHNINEDKLIGPFFAFYEYKDKELQFNEFIRIFENKIIMYLFEDAARAIRKKLFAKDKEESYLTYSKLCVKFRNEGVKIFCERIQNKFIKENGEEIETNLL